MTHARALLAAVAFLALGGCSGAPTSPVADADAIAPRMSGYTFGSGSRSDDPAPAPTSDVTTANSAGELSAVGDSTSTERGGYTFGSGS